MSIGDTIANRSFTLTQETPTTGVVTSPNHPGNYPNYFAKTETIQVKQGSVILLQFAAFNIEPHPNCAFDNLTITDGDGTTLLEKTCGSTLPSNITSLTNVVNTLFRTNANGTESGWSVSWSAVTPGVQQQLPCPINSKHI